MPDAVSGKGGLEDLALRMDRARGVWADIGSCCCLCFEKVCDCVDLWPSLLAVICGIRKEKFMLHVACLEQKLLGEGLAW